MSMSDACTNMIKQQLRTGDILNETVLSLYEKIQRENFVPHKYKHFAYSDMQIPLGKDQLMMTPLEEAKLLQALDLQGHETVLEVGTGSGYLTALLSKLADKVISIDYFGEFTEEAQEKLKKHEINNVELLTQDAYNGCLDRAPFDVVIFTGALKEITRTHQLQVLPGGKLFAIVGEAPTMLGELHTLNHEDSWHSELVFETCVPQLINKSHTRDFIF